MATTSSRSTRTTTTSTSTASRAPTACARSSSRAASSSPTDEIAELGNRKNELVLKLIDEQGVEVYEGSVRYVKAAIDAGLRRAVVSSSTNCRAVLESAGILDLFEEIVDGHVAEDEGLKGKPAPDTFLAGATQARRRPLGGDRVRGRASRASRRGGPATSASSSASTASATPRRSKTHGGDVVVADLAELLDR